MRKIRRIDLRISEQEYELILQKMKQSKSTNLSAYMIKMAIDGMVINLNMPELKEVASLLRYNGNNINQIAKRLNESKSVYASDIEDIKVVKTHLRTKKKYLQNCIAIYCDLTSTLWHTKTYMPTVVRQQKE